MHGVQPRPPQTRLKSVRLPSKRYLLQLFPPARLAGFVMLAAILTFASSLIPRPVYGAGEQTIRFGYPLPYLNVLFEPPGTPIEPVFINW
jgi:hypothetical protein